MQRDFGVYIPNGCKYFKVFLQLFYGNESNSNKPLKIKNNLWNWEISFTFSWYVRKNIFVYFYFISIEASIRNELSHDIFLKFLLSLLWSLRSEDNYGWSLRFWRSFFSFSGKTALNLENVRQVSVKIYKKYHEKIKFLP